MIEGLLVGMLWNSLLANESIFSPSQRGAQAGCARRMRKLGAERIRCHGSFPAL